MEGDVLVVTTLNRLRNAYGKSESNFGVMMKVCGALWRFFPLYSSCVMTYRSLRLSMFWLIYRSALTPTPTSSMKRKGKDTMSCSDRRKRIVDSDFSYA